MKLYHFTGTEEEEKMGRRMFSFHRKERLFTLIELLIVTTIIAILASMLLPALNTVRRKAHSAACISKLKQLSLAFQGYAVDNRDIFMCSQQSGPDGDVNSGNALVWIGAFRPYLGLPVKRGLFYNESPKGPFACPEQRNWQTGGGCDLISYGYNPWLFGQGDFADSGGTKWKNVMKVGKVLRPSESVVLCDAWNGMGASGRLWGKYRIDDTRWTAFRHTRRANGMFTDGHVEPKPLLFYQGKGIGYHPWNQNNAGTGGYNYGIYDGSFSPY